MAELTKEHDLLPYRSFDRRRSSRTMRHILSTPLNDNGHGRPATASYSKDVASLNDPSLDLMQSSNENLEGQVMAVKSGRTQAGMPRQHSWIHAGSSSHRLDLNNGHLAGPYERTQSWIREQPAHLQAVLSNSNGDQSQEGPEPSDEKSLEESRTFSQLPLVIVSISAYVLL